MEIVEAPLFGRRVAELLSDDEYRVLQEILNVAPEIGEVIVGTGGARKVRCRTRERGKSGGVRIIYYYAAADGTIYMLMIYGKNETDSLTGAQKNALKKIIADLD